MEGKESSSIARIIVNEATFTNVEIEPTYINFFYGKNGAGKSTIANAINAKGNGIIPNDGKKKDDINILLYNQDFVRKNIRDDAILPGVFTVKEENNDKIDRINADMEKIASLAKERVTLVSRKEELEGQARKVITDFQENCFSATKDIRAKFDKTQSGRKRADTRGEFVKDILSSEAREQDLDELQKLYDAAYDTSLMSLRSLHKVEAIHASSWSGYSLLSQSITSTANTPFSDFLGEIKASDWVQQGHTRFAAISGDKCPYCQQPLPDGFEDVLKKCFDATYQNSMDSLRELYAKYKNGAEFVNASCRENDLSQLPDTFDMQEYKDIVELIEKTCDANVFAIQDKLSYPTKQITLEDVDPMIERLNKIIEDSNKRIKEINDVVENRRESQKECVARVWQHMHFYLSDTIDRFEKDKKNANDQVAAAGKLIEENDNSANDLRKEIAILSSQMSNVTDTIESINKLLKTSGFTGFRLAETKASITPAEIVKVDGTIESLDLVPVENTEISAYKIERLDGSPARGLSEGERNFIAFLYFYHKVKGSETRETDFSDKVVVIDDPVTSMDSSSMFIVSKLIREMTDNCYTSYSLEGYDELPYHIRQIFLMTHNAYFHKEITYNQTEQDRYPAVTFFHVKKPKNDSKVDPCIRKSDDSTTPAYPYNFNPVKNSYAALWDEYKEVESSSAALNVIRRILEYYFVQLCGYDRYEFSDKILVEHRDRFVKNENTPQEDDTDYTIASSMLQFLTESSFNPSDDMYYMEDIWEIGQCQDIFKTIFEVMDQAQHFIAMTTRK